jgi:chemotaxis protein methyltransferase CheR
MKETLNIQLNKSSTYLNSTNSTIVIQDIDIKDLKTITEILYLEHGYDFRNYAMSSFKRRILRLLEVWGFTVESLINKLSTRSIAIDAFLDEMTVNVTEMFRDPGFWRLLRDDIIPAIMLNNKQFRIWHAGCSSGEEVLSMNIVLSEMGIMDKVKITATDLDKTILDKAMAASYTLKNMETNEKNYIRFQGNKTLKDYYTVSNGQAIMKKDLVSNVSFQRHDLVLGGDIGMFDLILCRNVMIYFNQALQNEVLKKFHSSLHKYGYLVIGAKESMIWCDYANRFIVVNQEEKVYKKIKD